MAVLDIQVQIALGSPDLTAFPTSWTWTDVTAYVLVDDRIAITIGRSDQYAQMPPASCRLTVLNTDGRWCRLNPTGAWYGQLTKNTPLRVRINNGGGYKDRFTGFIDELPARWDTSSNLAVAQISASGGLRRAQYSGPATSALFRANTSTFGTGDTIVGYWPCEDESGATSVASGIGGPAAVVAGTVNFAADSSIAGSAPLPKLTSTGAIVCTVPTYTATTQWAVRFVCRVPTEPAAPTILLQWHTPGSSLAFWNVLLTPGSPATVKVAAYNSSSVEQLGASGIAFIADSGAELFGEQVYFEIDAIQNGTGIDWQCYHYHLRNGSGELGTAAATTLANVSLAYTYAQPGTADVTIGHIAVDTHSPGPQGNAATGYANETAQSRWTRLGAQGQMLWDWVPSYTYLSPTMGAQPTDSLISQIRQIGDVEGVPIYDGVDGFSRLGSRWQRYNQTVALTLDFDSGHIAAPPEPGDDDRFLRNDVTASRIGGSSRRVTKSSGANSTLIGVYGDELSLNVYDDSVLQDRAAWAVHVGTVDAYRYSRLSLNLRRATTKTDAWLLCDVGSRIQLTNPPAQLPPDTVDLLIEGWTEVLTSHSWTVDLSCSPGEPYQVFQLEDSTLGRLDTSGSQLLTAMTSTATTMRVTPTAIGPAWSTTGTPYDLAVGGERVTVTTMTTSGFSFVAAGTAAHADNASLAPGLPAGAQLGDLLLVFAGIRNTAATCTAPTGYSTLYTTSNISLFGKIHTGTESAPTIAFSGGAAGDTTSAQMAAFRNCSGALNISALALNGSNQNVTYPALTWTVAPALLLYLGWKQDDWTSISHGGGAAQIGSFVSTLGNDQGMVWNYGTSSSASSVSSNVWTVTGGAAAISKGVTLAFGGDVQTATVTRSVNSVVKAQVAGTAVQLWKPGIGGLAV